MTEVLAPPLPSQRTSPEPGGRLLPDGWWVRALSLAERAALPGRPRVTTPTDRARRRLERWKKEHRLAETGQFVRRLAAVGLTEDDLLALLSEEPESLAARAGAAPWWAEFTEAVLADMPEATSVPVPDVSPEQAWRQGMTAILAPFIRYANRQLEEAVRTGGHDAHVDLPGLHNSFTSALLPPLLSHATRTLVLELNVLRVTERLVGDTPAQRFWSFVEHFSRRAEFAALLEEYPVLARVLAQTVGHAVESWRDLLRRLSADRPAIVAELFGGVDPGKVVEISGDQGDSHQRGRSVALLRFADGRRVVYKPRSQAAHAAFNTAVAWLNAAMPGLDLRRLTVLERDGYGWVEFADYLPCEDRSQVHRYHYRQGALLGLLYALNGADFHFENLIASGDQPVLVDLEALFHPRLPMGGSALLAGDPAAAALDTSVRRVGLLPSLVFGENGTVLDMGGGGGDAGVPMPYTAVGWDGAGTDTMRLVRRNPTFPGAKNRPRVAGAEADPAEYANDVAQGFRDAYETIRRRRDDFAAAVLPAFRGAELRLVARATQVYGTLLQESSHPDVMRDALDRDRIFDLLWAASHEDPARERLVPAELADLWRNDIPIFTVRPESRDVWTSTGQRLPDMLTSTGVADVTTKLDGLSDKDQQTQEWIIEASFASRMANSRGLVLPTTSGRDTSLASGVSAAVDRRRVLEAARAIGDRIADSAFRDGDRVGWLGMTFIEESRWQVQQIGHDLYSGYTGVALFLSQLARVTGEQRYADLARDAVAPLRVLEDELPAAQLEAFNGSAFSGLAGTAYALVHVATNLDEPELMSPVETIFEAVTPTVERDTAYDVISGCAGGIAAALAVHEVTGTPAALRFAEACAHRLREAARPQEHGVAWVTKMEATQPLAGFSHGAAGMGWALLRYAAATGDRAARETGLAAFAYERSLYREHVGNWPDFRVMGGRAPSDDEPGLHAWCHGSPGIGLSRIDLRHLGDPDIAADLDLALRAMVAAGPASNHSLCHGHLGNLELLTMAVAAGRTDLTPVWTEWVVRALHELEHSGPVCGTPGGVATPGLLSGLAGIGHGLLRIAEPERIPSVLLLHAPRGWSR